MEFKESVETAALHVEVKQLEIKLAEATVKFRESRIKDAGLSIGCIVVDRNGKEYRVVEIDAKYTSTIWVKGNPRKTNGEFGNNLQHVYGDWRLK